MVSLFTYFNNIQNLIGEKYWSCWKAGLIPKFVTLLGGGSSNKKTFPQLTEEIAELENTMMTYMDSVIKKITSIYDRLTLKIVDAMKKQIYPNGRQKVRPL